MNMQQLKSCSLEKNSSLMLWMHLCYAAEPESSHMLYIFGSCDAWIALDQTYMKLWCDQFSYGQMGFFDRIGHAFSTAPWMDPSVLGITHHCPCHYTPPGHLIHLAIKRTRCMCASFHLLGFIWIAWICSLGGPGEHFFSYQAFVLLWTLLAITYTCVPWQNGHCKDSDAISVFILVARILTQVEVADSYGIYAIPFQLYVSQPLCL